MAIGPRCQDVFHSLLFLFLPTRPLVYALSLFFNSRFPCNPSSKQIQEESICAICPVDSVQVA